MNKKTLLDALNTLVGKVFYDGRGYVVSNMAFEMEKAIKEAFKNEKIDNSIINDVRVNTNDSAPSYFYLEYRHHVICYIVAHKQRGNYIGYGRCEWEWLFKSFEIGLYSDDFDLTKECMKVIELEINNERLKEKREKEMFACYKQVKALFGDNTRNIIEYIYQNYYSLSEKEKKENA